MSWMPRQRLRPGIGGQATHTIDPAEAYRVENMLLGRDGVWRPRRAFQLPGGSTFSGITHVSNLNGSNLVVVQSGSLKVWQENSFVTTIDTGWPSASTGGTAGWIQHARAGLGATGPRQPVWVAPKRSRFLNAGADMYYVGTSPITGGVLTGGRLSVWVENHGLHNVGALNGSGNSIFFSDAADVASWGANDIDIPWKLGNIGACISLNESQVMLLGTYGIGVLTGNTLNNFSIGCVLDGVSFPYGGATAVNCAGRVLVLGAGPSVWEVGLGGIRRISQPIEYGLASGSSVGELRNRPMSGCNAWYDPIEQWYCLSSNASPATTWIFDLARDRWIGTIPLHLAGMALIQPGDDATTFRKYYAVSGKLAYILDYGTPVTYADLGGASAFTCTIETAPEFHQAAEMEKQTGAGYLDATGTWTVTMRTRTGPDQAWTDTSVGTYSAPCWVHPPSLVYRERVFKFSASAAADIRFRGWELDERATGVPA